MDETEKEAPPMEIPAERMLAFLTAKKANTVCPICRTKEWTAMEDADNRGFLLTSQSSDSTSGAKVLPLMALVCNNCHYVWIVARRPVEAWLKEHPDGNNQ